MHCTHKGASCCVTETVEGRHSIPLSLRSLDRHVQFARTSLITARSFQILSPADQLVVCVNHACSTDTCRFDSWSQVPGQLHDHHRDSAGTRPKSFFVSCTPGSRRWQAAALKNTRSWIDTPFRPLVAEPAGIDIGRKKRSEPLGDRKLYNCRRGLSMHARCAGARWSRHYLWVHTRCPLHVWHAPHCDDETP